MERKNNNHLRGKIIWTGLALLNIKVTQRKSPQKSISFLFNYKTIINKYIQILNFQVYFVGNINVVMGMKLLSKEYREEIDSGLLVLIPKLIKELVPNSNNIKLIQTSINNNSSQQQNNNNKCEGDSIEDVDILLLCTGY